MNKTGLALMLALAAGPLFAAPAKKVPSVRDLIEASGAGNITEISRLLKAGVSVNGRLTAADNAMSPLSVAVMLGQVESVKALLDAKANINQTDALGDTPLHKSCFPPAGKDPAANAKAKMEIAKILLAAKAKVNLKDKEGWTPLMLAASAGNAGMVKLLLDAGADAAVRLSSGKSALALAQQGGHLEAAAMLVPKKAAKP